jgi:hypothetical protein
VPLPAGITPITVTGTYLNGDGTPATGRVTFTPTTTVTDPSGPAIFPTLAVTAVLDATGHFSVILGATDDATTQPAGWLYQVIETINKVTRPSYLIALPHTTTLVDMASLSPQVAQPPSYGYATIAQLLAKLDLTGGTMTGPLNLAADPTTNLQAATKHYVDNAPPSGGPYLPLAGGTMTGALTEATIYGSSASGGNLQLNSTSNATKGKILLGTGAAWDALNSRFGVGTQSPTVKLDVEATTSGQVGLFRRTATGDASTVLQVLAGDNTGTGVLAVSVDGDATSRYGVAADGATTWGPGSGSRDTKLYRNAAGELKTDTGLTVVGSGTIGGAQLLAGGAGVLGIRNAGTPPSSTPSGGVVLYASGGGLFARDAGGVSLGIVDGPPAGAPPTGAIGETIPRWAASATTNVKTGGTLYCSAVWLQAGQVVSNISLISGATAASGPTHWWFALLDRNMTLRGHTADQTSGAIAANTLITKALVTPYTATYSGLHYVGVMVTASTTMPTWLESGIAMANQSVASPPQAGPSSTGLTTPGTDGTTTYATITQNSGFAAIYAYLS